MRRHQVFFLLLPLVAIASLANAESVTTRVKVLPAKPAETVVGDRTPPTITITAPEVKRGVKITVREARIVVAGKAEDDSGVAVVTVNGEPAALDGSGNFSAEVLLKPGENTIEVAAVDVRRNQSVERFQIGREAVAVPAALAAKQRDPSVQDAPSPLPKTGGYHALVIGINRYRHLDPLTTAVNDAREVAKTLEELYGFRVTILLDEKATRAAIIKSLNTLRRQLTPEDRLLVYYAGHGEYNRETDTAYWLPVDAERDETTNWIESKNVTDLLKLLSVRHVLIVADSCYSGTMTRRSLVDLSAGDTRENYLRKIQEKTSRVLIASGGNEPVTDAGGGKHSIFADVFLRALRNPERDIFTAEELHVNYVKERVAGRAEQTPEYKVIRNSGHDGGDFVFVKRK